MEEMVTDFLSYGDLFKKSGLTLNMLLVFGGLFLVTLTLSVRELLLWYLKMNDIQKQLQGLQQSIFQIERHLGIPSVNRRDKTGWAKKNRDEDKNRRVTRLLKLKKNKKHLKLAETHLTPRESSFIHQPEAAPKKPLSEFPLQH